MNKRTLLVLVLSLALVGLAYASTVTIIYPTPVEGLDTHIANTTTAHDTAATKASLATLSADVITRAGINGSSTQNFSVATLTVGNISGMRYAIGKRTGNLALATSTETHCTFDAEVDPYSNFDGATYTVSVSGLYEVFFVCEIVPTISISGLVAASLYKNGAVVTNGGSRNAVPSSSLYGSSTTASCLLSLSVGDKLSCKGFVLDSDGTPYFSPYCLFVVRQVQ